MKQWSVWLAATLLVFMATLAVLAANGDSATYDEVAHIPAGYSYLVKQDYRLNPEHPPLIKDFAALPLLFLDLHFPEGNPAWTEATGERQWSFGRVFLYETGNNPDQILFWARMSMVALLVFLGWFIFQWARELAGTGGALFALFLFAFSPTFLAHGHLVTTDIAAVFGFMLAMFFYLRFLQAPSFKSTMLAGVTLGVALLLKFSTLLLLPFLGFLTLLYIWAIHNEHSREFLVAKYIRGGLLVGSIALLIVGLVYQAHLVQYAPAQQVADSKINLAEFYGVNPESISFPFTQNIFLRPYAHYIGGALIILWRSSVSTVEYFLGSIGFSGWWYYFPALYLFKVPIAFHILGILALFEGFVLIKHYRDSLKSFAQGHFVELSFFLFVALYTFMAVTNKTSIGIRHILPLFPFLYILVALGVKKWLAREIFFPWFKKGILAILLGWYGISSLASFPFYLSYYNELAGGIQNGYKIAVDSNYDWGQDMKRLVVWMDEHDVQMVYLDYFGKGNPEQYYLPARYMHWRGSWRWGEQRESGDTFPRPNYLAVSATLLQGGRWNGLAFERNYAWLDSYEPVGRAGSSIFVYYID